MMIVKRDNCYRKSMRELIISINIIYTQIFTKQQTIKKVVMLLWFVYKKGCVKKYLYIKM